MKHKFAFLRIAAITAMVTLVLSVCAPVWADGPEAYAMDASLISTSANDLKDLEIHAYGTDKYLNVVGTTSSAGKNVSTYSRSGNVTQKWYVYRGSDNITTIRPSGHLDLSIIRVGESNGANCEISAITQHSLAVLQIEPLSGNTARVRLTSGIHSGYFDDYFWLKYGSTKLGNDVNYYNVMWERTGQAWVSGGNEWIFTRA